MEQTIVFVNSEYRELEKWIVENQIKNLMIVCDTALQHLKIRKYFDSLKKMVNIVRFDDFHPNPLYESVVKGVKLFRETRCSAIIAVGGGSAMDVAKCIKLYSSFPGDGKDGVWLNTEIESKSNIPFLAMPTTAGTGSEATRYAVVYWNGTKQSITNESIIPETVIMDPSVLKTLPLYQKKATMCDALCHAIESFWSVNSTEESREYSREAIRGIIMNMDGYLENTDEGNSGMLIAAHVAGKAINIAQTTAGHAMCYKITSLFGVAHGHAALLCDRVLLPWMIRNTDKCIDLRGEKYLKKILCEIANAMGAETSEQGADKLKSIFDILKLDVPTATKKQYEELMDSVNIIRLKNHPIALNEEIIDYLYHKMLR